MIRTLIVEDEALARQELIYLLRTAHPDVEVVGEAPDADAARAALRRLRPDLLLLDISLPGATGFELLESLDDVPPVIFITAYDQFATRAFEVSALDYVLKPINPARLAQALDRVRTGLALRGRAEGPSGTAAGASEARLTPQSQVFLKDGEHCYFVRLAEIDLFEGEGNYVRVYFGANRPLLHKSLQLLEEKLPPELFFRANRQQILNLTTIERVHSYYKGGLLLELRGGRRVDVSTRQAVRFKELLSL